MTHVSLLSVGAGTGVYMSLWGPWWCPPVAGSGCGCGAVVRRRTGVAPGEGGLGFPSDDVVRGWHVFGDILEQRVGQELVTGGHVGPSK